MHDGQLVFSLVVFWVLAFDDPRGHFSVEIQHPHLPESNMPCLSFFLTTINPSGQRWRFRVCASSFSTSGWVFFVLRPFQWRDFQRCCANFCGPNTKIFRDFHVFSSIGSWFYGSFRDPVMNWIIIDIYIYISLFLVCVCVRVWFFLHFHFLMILQLGPYVAIRPFQGIRGPTFPQGKVPDQQVPPAFGFGVDRFTTLRCPNGCHGESQKIPWLVLTALNLGTFWSLVLDAPFHAVANPLPWRDSFCDLLWLYVVKSSNRQENGMGLKNNTR